MKFNVNHTLLMRWVMPATFTVLSACGGAAFAANDAYVATLNGAQETPTNASMAKGSGTASVDTMNKMLTAMVTTTGMTGVAAHIHQGLKGVSGPVIFKLTEVSAGSGKWGTTVTLTDEQYKLLQTGNYYFNVHSANYPDGEIRGQIMHSSSEQPKASGGIGGY